MGDDDRKPTAGGGASTTSRPEAKDGAGTPPRRDTLSKDSDQLDNEKLAERRLGTTLDGTERIFPEELFHRLFGGSDHRVDTVRPGGAAAQGDDATAIGTQNIYLGPARESGGLSTTTLNVTTELKRHSATPVDGKLEQALKDQNLVCLTGHSGTGRSSTAKIALAHRHHTDEIVILHRQSDLIGVARHLVRDRGHLIETQDEVLETSILDVLNAAAQGNGATIVIVPRGLENAHEPTRYVLEHTPPDPLDVFAEHLRARLKEAEVCIGSCTSSGGPCLLTCVDTYVAWCLSVKGLVDQFARIHRIQHAVRLAADVAERLPRLENEVCELVEHESDGRVRALARRMLTPSGPELSPAAIARLRAYRIAYTALNGCPLSVVADAADHLFTLIAPPTQPDQVPEAGFNGSAEDLDTLIPAEMGARLAPGSGGIATLRNGSLVPVLLEVAWNELPGMHRAFIPWLDELATNNSAIVRRSAAALAGYFAGMDPPRLFNELIDEWSKHLKTLQRQAAALACNWAARDERLKGLVAERIKRWAKQRSALRQDTVARAFGVANHDGAGVNTLLHPAQSLNLLRYIASSPKHHRNPNLAAALYSMLTVDADTASSVVEALLDWLHDGNPYLAVHACRGLVDTARPSTGNTRSHPPLLLWADGRAERIESLATLWREAMLLPPTAPGAWKAMEKWVALAVYDDGLATKVLDLMSRICVDEPLRERLAFQPLAWERNLPSAPVIERLNRLTKGTSKNVDTSPV